MNCGSSIFQPLTSLRIVASPLLHVSWCLVRCSSLLHAVWKYVVKWVKYCRAFSTLQTWNGCQLARRPTGPGDRLRATRLTGRLPFSPLRMGASFNKRPNDADERRHRRCAHAREAREPTFWEAWRGATIAGDEEEALGSLRERALRGDWHLKRYDLHNSETYGWKPSYPTSYESHACPLSSGIW